MIKENAQDGLLAVTCLYVHTQGERVRTYVVDPGKKDHWPIPTNVNRALPSFATPFPPTNPMPHFQDGGILKPSQDRDDSDFFCLQSYALRHLGKFSWLPA